jgi:hypothetical protein
MPTTTATTYDELTGPGLDAEHWSPARLPLPSGEMHLAQDPGAELTVGEGEVRVTLPRFTLADDRFQAADSAKYLVVSTREFALPADGTATFAVDQAVENVGGDPADHRRGMAAFHVFDLKGSTLVFSTVATSTRAFAMHEQLAGDEPFIYVIESPYADFEDDLTRLRRCEISLDRGSSTAVWRIDGQTVYEARGAVIPERVQIGFGIWTQLPIRDGRSQSLEGQGLNARWRGFQVIA